MHFEILKEHVLKYDLMSDKLIIKDIHLIASNDDQYFVFEDVLHQVITFCTYCSITSYYQIILLVYILTVWCFRLCCVFQGIAIFC